MTSKLRVVAYNVRFGDAILIEIPERDGRREVVRRILIDVGNVLAGAGGVDAVFEPVARDLLERLDGRPIDLYVMTHEHLDHVQGLPRAAQIGLPIPVSCAWLTASAEPEYYDRFLTAARRLAIAQSHYELVKLAAERRGLLGTASMQAFLANNDRVGTQAAVAFLREMAPTTRYVHRGFRPVSGRDHSFTEAKVSLWAPELDTSTYYGRVTPFVASGSKRTRAPAGVDAAAFKDLMAFLGEGLADSMLAIDRAANDTSVVLEVQWRGWRLLFPGHAETRSWQLMARHKQVHPVHLFKVGHHGSRNALPPEPVLDLLLPRRRRDGRRRTAVLSTWPETYPGVPDELTIERLRSRVDELVTTRSAASGSSVTVELEG